MKNSLEDFKSRHDQAEKNTSELRDRSFEIIESKRKKKNEEKWRMPKVPAEPHYLDQY